MKRFIIKLLLFIPFTLCTYLMLLIVWARFAPADIHTNLKYPIGGYAHMFSRIQEARSLKNIDILFLGASHTYRGFDPRIFKKYGYTSFNLGSSNQTPLQTKILLDRYLKILNPKLIIYEVNPRTFEFDGVESSLDLIPNDRIDFGSFSMALKLNNVKTYNALLYGCYRQFLNKDKNFKEDRVKGEDLYIPGGYVEKRISYNQELGYPYKKRPWRPLQFQLDLFADILKMIKNKGIKMILVQSPVTRPEFHQYDESNKLIDEYFTSKQFPYYNFNHLLNLNDSLDFLDSHHLNQNGVKIFDEEIIRKIEHSPLQAFKN